MTRLDKHIGKRIRQCRAMLGLTLDDVAVALGVSYQQVQKYETAANRISAGRLYQIARRLDVDVSFFFEGIDDRPVESAERNPERNNTMPHGGTMRSTIDVAQHFTGIPDLAVRSAVARLVKALSQNQAAEVPEPLRNNTVPRLPAGRVRYGMGLNRRDSVW